LNSNTSKPYSPSYPSYFSYPGPTPTPIIPPVSGILLSIKADLQTDDS